MSNINDILLNVRNLTAGYYTPTGGFYFAVTGVSFDVFKNEILAIVGESGCGKSTLALSIYNNLHSPGKVLSGEVLFEGKDLLKMSKEELRSIRMTRISFVPQYAMDSLDPVTKIGDFMKMALREHGYGELEAEKLIREKLSLMRLPPEVVNMYPLELSGGMRQRVVLATSMLLNPDLIILDEPTTGLDVIVQYEILRDLKIIQRKLGFSILIISHDLPLMMMFADRIAVMYAGEIVEIGSKNELLDNPRHPYTYLLLNSVPSIIKRREVLLSIPGNPPLLTSIEPGCRFYDRCPFRLSQCKEELPRYIKLSETHHSKCFRANENFSSLTLKPEYYEELNIGGYKSITSAPSVGSDGVALSVRDLHKVYTVWRGLRRIKIYAVNGVSFNLRRGVITALVGGSGHGKSTIAKIIAGIEKQTSGSIFLDGKDFSKPSSRNTMEYRSKVQMVFQDPYSSLDPRHTVEWHIRRPLIIHGKVKNENDLKQRVVNLLTLVGLKPPEKYLNRYPHELSGGERQRVSIARALAVEPAVLIADEPVSMLDASVRAGILNVLKMLRNLNLAILYITHDLATVSYIADEVMVIYNGQIVEKGDVKEVIYNPKHEYTKRLIEAVPDPYKEL
ncbi:MAG: ABC transporter ATP-binding protein [Caldivirga sp.]